jgi:hypothetical protein
MSHSMASASSMSNHLSLDEANPRW